MIGLGSDNYRDPSKLLFSRDYSRKRKESVWAAFLNLLNRPDGFIQNMTSRSGVIQGGFFYWSALKMPKCQTLRKF